MSEVFAAPPTGDIDWQLDETEPAAARCASPLETCVERRGYRPGERDASVCVY